MPVPLLIVELPASDVGRPETAALLEACTAGLGAGRCEIREGPPVEAATAVAVVAFRGPDHSSALVEVGRRSAAGQAWLSDELVFQPGDPVAERFRALGLTMATLFRELESPKPGSDPPKPPKAEARAPAALPQPATPAPPRAVPRLGFALGPYVAGDGQLGAARWGGLGSIFFRPLELPLALTLSARYSVAEPSVLSMTWTTLGLGLGWTWLLPGDYGIRARLEGVAERVGASTTDADAGQDDSQSHWVGGVRPGLDLSWRPAAFWGLSLNLELTRFSSRTAVTVHGTEVASTGAWVYGAGLALELHPRL